MDTKQAAVRVVDGKPLSCKTCTWCGSSKHDLTWRQDIGLPPSRSRYIDVICCNGAKMRMFRWWNTELEPFCSGHKPLEDTHV